MSSGYRSKVEVSLRLLAQLLSMGVDASGGPPQKTQALLEACVQRLGLTVKLYVCEIYENHKRLKQLSQPADMPLTTLLKGVVDTPEAVELQSLLSQSDSWLYGLAGAERALSLASPVDYSKSIFSTEDSEDLGIIASSSQQSIAHSVKSFEDVSSAAAGFAELIARQRACNDEY